MRLNKRTAFQTLLLYIFLALYFKSWKREKQRGSQDEVLLKSYSLTNCGRFTNESGVVCRPFKIPLWTPTFLPYKNLVRSPHPLICRQKVMNWIQVEPERIIITNDLKTCSYFHCNFTEILRFMEYYHVKLQVTVSTDNYYPRFSDTIEVACACHHTKFNETYLVPKVNPVSESCRKVPSDERGYSFNILYLVYDGISRNFFVRNLPKTWQFMKSKMRGIEFHGHSALGLNSAPNQIPLWTGYDFFEWLSSGPAPNNFVEELPPILLASAAEKNYVTMFYEDLQANSMKVEEYSNAGLPSASGETSVEMGVCVGTVAASLLFRVTPSSVGFQARENIRTLRSG
ncbi:unnamed protein product [Notodromas monacha]|uniref:Uncharacterized protein n=1 Tax=Notodromas monacha TaxID=399045 RepID=A0A7R9GFZ4_9CRUS|nr:unnamed protein product [Notodromas monacha]CAG0919436.1 unnamed protein product [Notodromas monacha]